jgi:A/G-specific adenine glycosylase
MSDPLSGQHPITRALLDGYAAHRRDLPWRRTADPYLIWVSEVMLQQTQVVTVIPYYERFIARYPTACALAAANLDDVLALWQGLGYYARARNLHAAAGRVCAEHDGLVPDDPVALRALPGVGEYMAAAILSIAFGQDVAAIDGNVVRVLCRLYDYAGDPTRAQGRRVIRGYAEALLPPGRAGDYNQAMMEHGAMTCVPRGPLCPQCPVASFCLARQRGVQEQRPVPRQRREVPHRHLVAALCEQGDRLLLVRRRPRGLLGGLWELPGGETTHPDGYLAALRQSLADHLGVTATVQEGELAAVDHAYTHLRTTVHAYRCTIEGDPQPTGPWDRCLWLAPGELIDYGLTGVTGRILATVPWAGSGRLL